MDVPGIFDTDQIRVRTATDALESCDTVILTHRYSRITDSEFLPKKLRECALAGKNVFLDITRIDEAADADSINLGENEEKDNRILGADERKDSELQQLLKDLRKQKHDLEQARDEQNDSDQDDGASDTREAGEDSQEIRTLEADGRKLSDLINKRRLLVLKDSITKRMQEKYREIQIKLTGGARKELSVHCTCGPSYESHMKGYSRNERPRLTIEETGFPRLRGELRALRANEMLRVLADATDQKGLARLLTALHLYCISSKLKRKKDIQPYVTKPMDECTSLTDKIGKDLESGVGNIMESAKEEGIEDLTHELLSLLENWSQMHHATFRAFCNFKGHHRLKDGKHTHKVSWNDLIFEKLEEAIDDAFEKSDEKIKDSKQKLLALVAELMNGIIQNLKGKPIPRRKSRCFAEVLTMWHILHRSAWMSASSPSTGQSTSLVWALKHVSSHISRILRNVSRKFCISYSLI